MKKKSGKAETLKILMLTIFILMVGAVTLTVLNIKNVGNLEGYRLGSFEQDSYVNVYNEATSCNATSTNATSCNATSCNATSTNATSGDATSCNATSTDATSGDATSSNVTVSKNVKTEKVVVDIDEQDATYNYDNKKITTKDINNIKLASGDIVVVINANNNSVVHEEVFDSIKGTNKQLIIKYGDNQIIFNGSDISTVKNVDTSINIYPVSQSTDSNLKEATSKAIILEFADNGDLPGNAVVRIKVTDEMKKSLTDNSLDLYYYNKTNNTYELVQTNVTIDSEGYCNLTIDHNSTFILVNHSQKIKETISVNDNSNINSDKEEVVSFLNSKWLYIGIIGVSLVIILIVVIIITINKKKKNKIDSNENFNQEVKIPEVEQGNKDDEENTRRRNQE